MSQSVYFKESQIIMQTIKTSELTGAALDWVVANCEGIRVYIGTNHTGTGPCINDADLVDMGVDGSTLLRYSTDWADGGPIIEREGISLGPARFHSGEFFAYAKFSNEQFGPTPLIAAMRCYVASKLGDTVDVPDELAV